MIKRNTKRKIRKILEDLADNYAAPLDPYIDEILEVFKEMGSKTKAV